MQHHLAIVHRVYLDKIVCGQKEIECRLGRIGYPPHGFVCCGDLIWFKESSGPIGAVASVRSVRYVEPLTRDLLVWIRGEFNDRICAPASFWESGERATVATLIWLEHVCPLRPFDVAKRDRRAWVVLAEPPIPGRPIVSRVSQVA